MRIALAGNPNSGKTTMFNALTGRNERVGNWAGVTVEKKEHPVKRMYCAANEKITAVDLPGAYSMSPFTAEESVIDKVAVFTVFSIVDEVPHSVTNDEIAVNEAVKILDLGNGILGLGLGGFSLREGGLSNTGFV